MPFILKCGKALDDAKVDVRVQFRNADPLYPAVARNELVVRVQPNEAVYAKVMIKKPGTGAEPVLSELEVNYARRYAGQRIPDAYEALLLDVLRGGECEDAPDWLSGRQRQRMILLLANPDFPSPLASPDRSNFVRDDELREAWRIFTPLLHRLEEDHVVPLPYAYGSRGPAGLDEFVARRGFVRHALPYDWDRV